MRQTAKAVRKRRNKIVQDVASNILTGVAKTTPVLTGRAKYNWQVKLDASANTSLYAPNYGKRGAALFSISRGIPTIKAYNGERNKAINITNNLVYIDRLNQGYSQQAPAGYVQQQVVLGITKVNFKQILG